MDTVVWTGVLLGCGEDEQWLVAFSGNQSPGRISKTEPKIHNIATRHPQAMSGEWSPDLLLTQPAGGCAALSQPNPDFVPTQTWDMLPSSALPISELAIAQNPDLVPTQLTSAVASHDLGLGLGMDSNAGMALAAPPSTGAGVALESPPPAPASPPPAPLATSFGDSPQKIYEAVLRDLQRGSLDVAQVYFRRAVKRKCTGSSWFMLHDNEFRELDECVHGFLKRLRQRFAITTDFEFLNGFDDERKADVRVPVWGGSREQPD
jgi:hypothetical protein